MMSYIQISAAILYRNVYYSKKKTMVRSINGAVKSVKEGKGLREASRSYGVPVETLRRPVLGAVEIDCRPGPPTIFTKEEEGTLCEYLITMADMGYGLTAVKDRQTNPSKVFRSHKPEAETSSNTTSEPSLFTPEQEVL